MAVSNRTLRALGPTYHFIRLGRPLFLWGGILQHALGVLMALFLGARLDLPALIWGQIAITAIQLTTHYSNEYFDLAADKANPTPTSWSGGSRVLAEDHLPARIALVTSLVAAAVALLAITLVGPGSANRPAHHPPVTAILNLGLELQFAALAAQHAWSWAK